MTSIWDRANPHLRDLALYEPGKPIEETARESGLRPDQIIKLASNENPLGPSPRALEAMRCALAEAHLYPDGGGFYLRNALAEKLKMAPENIILGNGSNEIIEFIGHAFLRPGVEVATSENAFIAYKLVASLFDAAIVEVADTDYRFDLDALLQAITSRTRVIFIANPNNPTGTLVPQETINRFLEQVPNDIVVVFDEAYFEYLNEPPDTVQFVRQNRPVIVLRTFSKIHGLANLRLGYGIAHPELIRVLQKTREPFNTNGIAQAGALAALADEEHQAKTKRLTEEGRKYFEEEFAKMNLPFVPSVANFVLVRVGDGNAIFEALLRKGIIVRALSGYTFPEWMRVSVGTMEQNRRCIAALRDAIGDVASAVSADGAGRSCVGSNARSNVRVQRNPPLFLITFNTHGRRHLLACEQVHVAFVEYCARASDYGIGVGRYVVMPDHIHLFVCVGTGSTVTLSTWIKGLKRHLDKCLSSLGRQPLALPGQELRSFWQPGFHDRLLRHDESYKQKWNYVRENPVRAGVVHDAADWPYAGEILVIDRV